ncbi:capsid protein [Ostreococcus lucimarinus virus OlV3]|nr:capsid protein [Ostreococcus lucimarinus virus OlV3]
MAGVVQLLASGAQDRFFTIDPDYTYFLQSFKKHSNFAREYVDIDAETAVDFGGKARFKVAQNTGDLLLTLSVKIKLPTISTILYTDPRFIESIGHALIEYADLIVGGKVIQRLTSDYLQIHSEHFVTQTKQRALKQLIGKYPERTIDTRVSDKDILGNIGTADTEDEFFVDLPFYFYNNPELAVPLCAIKKQEVEVEIKIRNHDHLIIKGTTGELQAVTPGSIHLKDFSLCAEVAFIDPCERIKIENEKMRDYIITQVQQNVFDVAQGVQDAGFKLDFYNPVRELYFVIQRQGDTGTGEGQFITPFDYDNTLADTGGKYILYENLDYLTLDLDGQPTITQETGNVIFLKAVQAAIHHSKTQLIRRFYSYSFALEPEKWYPTGQINFSLVKEQILNLSLTPCADYARQVRVYAVSHNILRVSEGTARTLFDLKY